MRTQADALRSVRRYVTSALGSPPWRVALSMERFKRPFAFVNDPAQGPVQMAGPSSVRQSLPVVVQLYPPLPGDGVDRAAASKIAAINAGELVNQALMVGVPDAATEVLRAADPELPVVRGHYRRIPLWSYEYPDGSPLPLDGDESVAWERFHCDYLWVDDGWSVQTRPEASEDHLFVAIVNLRVQWFRSSALRSAGMTLQRVQINTESGG